MHDKLFRRNEKISWKIEKQETAIKTKEARNKIKSISNLVFDTRTCEQKHSCTRAVCISTVFYSCILLLFFHSISVYFSNENVQTKHRSLRSNDNSFCVFSMKELIRSLFIHKHNHTCTRRKVIKISWCDVPEEGENVTFQRPSQRCVCPCMCVLYMNFVFFSCFLNFDSLGCHYGFFHEHELSYVSLMYAVNDDNKINIFSMHFNCLLRLICILFLLLFFYRYFSGWLKMLGKVFI